MQIHVYSEEKYIWNTQYLAYELLLYEDTFCFDRFKNIQFYIFVSECVQQNIKLLIYLICVHVLQCISQSNAILIIVSLKWISYLHRYILLQLITLNKSLTSYKKKSTSNTKYSNTFLKYIYNNIFYCTIIEKIRNVLNW